MDYYERAGLTPYLDKLGFNLVGYGCTTCIGNSGPLIPSASPPRSPRATWRCARCCPATATSRAASTPDVKMNYLASPPLVVAYALAGTMDIDLTTEPLGTGTDGQAGVPARPLAVRRPRSSEVVDSCRRGRRCSPATTRTCSAVTSAGRTCDVPTGRHVRLGPGVDLRAAPAVLRGDGDEPSPVTDIHGARVLAVLGDSVTTDHISPAGAIKTDSPAGQVPDRARRAAAGLQQLRLPARQPRGDDPRHVRQHPAAQPAGARHRGRRDPAAARRRADVHLRRAAAVRRPTGVPLVVLAGKEYGSGSSRDWAAKGTALLGVRAVLAESFERIHRSNLIGMGVLPLQFTAGESAESLGLTGHEVFDITGIEAMNCRRHAAGGHRDGRRQGVHGRRADRHPRRGRVLPARRDHAVRAAVPARRGPRSPACRRSSRSCRPACGCLRRRSPCSRRCPWCASPCSPSWRRRSAAGSARNGCSRRRWSCWPRACCCAERCPG